MSRKAINQELLWKSIFWVLYQYANKTATEQLERPIRGYQPDDGKVASMVIRTIRKDYFIKMGLWKSGLAEKPDFEHLKDVVVTSLMNERGWSMDTRNYFSSVAATYITWDAQGIAADHQLRLTEIVSYANMFFRPTRTA